MAGPHRHSLNIEREREKERSQGVKKKKKGPRICILNGAKKQFLYNITRRQNNGMLGCWER